MRPVLAAAPEDGLGVAVSGGSDSTALLLLLHRWAGETGRRLAAVTVDHGLRAESAAEARTVAALCARLGIPHAVRGWAAAAAGGNLQMRAREARLALIADWARKAGLGAVALGHTRDDQAETVILRLLRGSGVDGLAGMAPLSERHGILWLRPMLGIGRDRLRAWLAAQGEGWIEDPSNDDPAFDRVRARRALAELGRIGLTPEGVARTAERMARARAALEADTRALARIAARPGAGGDLFLDPGPLAASPREIALRLLAAGLMWVAASVYRPRHEALNAALDALIAGRAGRGLSLAGCVIRPVRGQFAIRREPARVAPPVPLSAGCWDGRWRLVAAPPGVDATDLLIGAAGAEALALAAAWRARGIARETALTTPAIRDRAGRLVAAPLVGGDRRWRFERVAPLPPPWRDRPLARP
jgi:tRNA(Ile)-lysidine synthase